MPLGALDISSLKLRIILKDDLEFAAMYGVCGVTLWSVAMCLRESLQGDVQVCEGYNSLVKISSTRCRNISLPLLAARVGLKKTLGLGSRGASSKWSNIRERALEVLNQALSHYDEASVVLGNADRWTPPQIDPELPDAYLQHVCPALVPQGRHIWAATQSICLHRLLREPTVVRAFRLREQTEDTRSR